ncbi:3-deoxy-7-phosphoheptulonate synthase [Anaeromyces robustus]|uniref:Phospho-2-dehydro-3-deoxyheptonate aldolase n=1 Tax=Anaeromyces robustus TaxID=1754192 RepID=A0A1Y1XCT5_9FUNG|nr:3-deoxy-7-phosphoheptulonate synthase [Anaeromyces robustus]|eukprot:ORX83535.1 3-deoxy-7-phosphoheptulonate synthase [Anaeromyces robustus]
MSDNTAAATTNTSSKKELHDSINELDNRRIDKIRPLIPPQILMEDYPLTEKAYYTVANSRKAIENAMDGKDDRLVVIVGPCSIHDVNAAKEYANKLKEVNEKVKDDLLIIMRVYFEKPRTIVGWKGLINDPYLDGSYQINKGLKIGRKLLLYVTELGLPTAVEFLDTISPQYIGDLVSWGAVGARTTESQIHRELASGLSCPIGFKNGTDGNFQVAIDGIRAASASHCFLSVTKQGISAIVETTGNSYGHIILRGGKKLTNYDEKSISDCASHLLAHNLPTKIMIDMSHGNSCKQFKKQLDVGKEICRQLKEADTSNEILGVMIESNLVEGRQNIPKEGKEHLVYGQSITDSCIGWEDTEKLIYELQEASKVRRANNNQNKKNVVRPTIHVEKSDPDLLH